jgi:uncharacterized protein YgbK (DUF1537 family)
MPGSHAQPAPIAREELLRALPPEWSADPLPAIGEQLARSERTFAVLDDDPTGTQTVHDALVVTGWSESELAEALDERRPFFYILTNTRSLPETEAVSRIREIARNLVRASRRVGREVVAGVRGDSTLRGHHPAETWALRDTIEQEQGQPFDGELIVPFFPEGGRITVGDVHYVLEGDRFVPAGQTEFARDAAFGFQASSLPAWTEEKTAGTVRASEVLSISIEDLRQGGPARVAALLEGVTGHRTVVVNAATYRDLEVLVQGLLQAEAAGKRFLYRTAAGFVRVRVGQSGRRLLTYRELYPNSSEPRTPRGGLIVVGSHVRRSTEQLEQALETLPDLEPIELQVSRVLDESQREAELRLVGQRIEQTLAAGREAVLFTSRQVSTAGDQEANLRLSQRVSSALVELVRSLPAAPRFLIAKGGITSSDLATEALGVRRAEVPGQVAAGVPCWLLGPGSRFPGLPYVIFPGNVGTAGTLAEVIRLLRGQPRTE